MAALAQQQQQMVEIIQRQQAQLSQLVAAQQQPDPITAAATGSGVQPQTTTAPGKPRAGGI